MANTNTVCMFENEKEFECFIKTEPHRVVGDEEINWNIDQELPGAPTLPGSNYKNRCPDLMGRDTNLNLVIVEMKLFKGNPTNDLDAIHKSVGQILDYATASEEVSPRLYVVVHPVASPKLEEICQFLRTNGIDIQQKAV